MLDSREPRTINSLFSCILAQVGGRRIPGIHILLTVCFPVFSLRLGDAGFQGSTYY